MFLAHLALGVISGGRSDCDDFSVHDEYDVLRQLSISTEPLKSGRDTGTEDRHNSSHILFYKLTLIL